MAISAMNKQLNAGFRQLLQHFFSYYSPLSVASAALVPKGSVIFCSNHASHVDGVALYHHFYTSDRDIALIAAADYFFRRNYRAVAQRLLPLISIERSATLNSVMTLIDDTKQFIQQNNNSLVIFPEGLRQRHGELNPFKPGSAILSHVLGIPIVPIYLQGTNKVLARQQLLPRRHPIKIFIGEAVYPDSTYAFNALHADPRIAQNQIEVVRQRIIHLALEEAGDIL